MVDRSRERSAGSVERRGQVSQSVLAGVGRRGRSGRWRSAQGTIHHQQQGRLQMAHRIHLRHHR